jgi:molybdenum cofactor biosynthesis enzyme MoaA
MILTDKYNRAHNYLRLSITDKCNLNCIYCNPSSISYTKSSKSEILNFDEIQRIVNIFVTKFEFKKIRLTGGEPFARKNIDKLIASLTEIKQSYPYELSVTTNGTLINGNLEKYLEKGLDRINFSLDSLNREKFKQITGSDKLSNILQTINSAELLGLKNIKINTVVMNGFNNDEILDFVEFVKDSDLTVRFIEYMPFSNNSYEKSKYIPNSEIKKIIAEKYELINPTPALPASREGVRKEMVLTPSLLAGRAGVGLHYIETQTCFESDWYNSNSTLPSHFLAGRAGVGLPSGVEIPSVSQNYQIKGYSGKVSFISSISNHFCNDCNRLRITSDGKLKLCLFSGKKDVLDLKLMIYEGKSDYEISESIINHLQMKEEFHADLEELISLQNNQMISIGG